MTQAPEPPLPNPPDLCQSSAAIKPPPLPAPAIADPRSAFPVVLAQTAIVLFVGVIPDFLSSAASLIFPHAPSHPGSRPFWFGAAYILVRSAVVSTVTLGMICWARERWATFGFRAPRWRDIPWTIAATLGSWILYYIYAIFAYATASILYSALNIKVPLQSSHHFTPPHAPSDIFWLIPMSLANGVAEELVMRAFLIPCFQRIFGGGRPGAVLALLLTSLIFASYHAYQGIYGILGAFAAGLVFGLVFLKTRSIWPIFLAHALMDAFALLMLGARQ